MSEEKLDKVIAGLECHRWRCDCTACPYNNLRRSIECTEALYADALELLKELSVDNLRLREMWAESTKKLSVACAERDFAAGLAQAYGDFVVAKLEQVHPDWYERLSDLDYDYNPVKNGEPWYRAEDVWNCIEAIPGDHPEFGAHMDEEVEDA